MQKLAFFIGFLAFLACRKKTTEKAVELQKPLVEAVENADSSAQKDAEMALALEFRRSPCFGSCPAFSVKIWRDGRGEYDGFRFAKRQGKFTAKVPAAWLVEVQKEFVARGIYGLAAAYPIDGRRIPDVPTTTVFFNGKRIEDNYDSPVELRKFEVFLDQKIEELDWEVVH